MEKITLKDIKKLCKIRKMNIKMNQKKINIINEYKKNNACIKIQNFYRKRLANSNILICPITLDIIKYPVFPFKPKGQNIYIYYDLKALIKYIKYSGQFIDPKTREIYNDKEIELLNKLSSTKIKLLTNDTENDLLVYESCIDEIIGTLRDIIEINYFNVYSINKLFNSLEIILNKIVIINSDINYIFIRIKNIINETCKIFNNNKDMQNYILYSIEKINSKY